MARPLSTVELADVIGAFTRMNIRLPTVDRLSFTTLSVLHTLATRGPQRIADLAAGEQVTQPAVTQIVNRLVRDGLVTRTTDPDDRRAARIEITTAGAAVVARRRDSRLAHLDRLVDRLTARERAAIAQALPALARIVELDSEITEITEGTSHA